MKISLTTYLTDSTTFFFNMEKRLRNQWILFFIY